MDEYIQKNENTSIELLFQTKGELYFRKKEHYYLKEILSSDEEIILSLGGGTPCYYNNMDLLQKEDVMTIYIKASVETLFDRLKAQKSQAFQDVSQKINEEMDIPMAPSYYTRLSDIDEYLNQQYPVNQAILMALELVLRYKFYQESE